MSYGASAHSVGTLHQEINVNYRQTIVTDELAEFGGTDTAPTPHELLPATIAACVSTMITLYARRHDWTLGQVRVDVADDAHTAPRRVAIDIHLPDGLTAEQIKRLRRVADACPVRRALEAGFSFEERLEPDLPRAGGSQRRVA